MTVREKVSAIEFIQETGRNDQEIRAAGQRAIEAGKRFISNGITENVVEPSAISYVIKGPGGLVTQMAMRVTWDDLGQGRRRVQFSVGDFVTAQSRVMMFIPLGPKSVPALTSARRFAEALRAELAAA